MAGVKNPYSPARDVGKANKASSASVTPAPSIAGKNCFLFFLLSGVKYPLHSLVQLSGGSSIHTLSKMQMLPAWGALTAAWDNLSTQSTQTSNFSLTNCTQYSLSPTTPPRKRCLVILSLPHFERYSWQFPHTYIGYKSYILYS